MMWKSRKTWKRNMINRLKWQTKLIPLHPCWYINVICCIQGGPKNRTCLSVDNSTMVTCKKVCDMSKVLECCRQTDRQTELRWLRRAKAV